MTGRIAAIQAVDARRTDVRRTISLLPMLVGLAAVTTVIPASVLSGMTDGSRGWVFAIASTLLVLVTVLSGGTYGLYLSLLVMTIGSLVADGGPTTFELIGLAAGLIVVHELVRFSLDARRPSRFGPGSIRGYLIRNALIIAALATLVVASRLLVQRSPTGGLWVPIGVAAAALPLFARTAAERFDSRFQLNSSMLRTVIATGCAITILGLVLVGAAARSEIRPDPAAPAASTTGPTTTIALPEAEREGTESKVLAPWVVILVVLVLAILIYLILRRPEAIFQLEDVERRVEDNTFDLAVAGLADADDEMIEVDSDALARLLRDLQMDIEAEQDPGRAIRFGYAKIEQRLADLGLLRTKVETEREFLQRALPSLGSAGQAMAELTNLFERARFGHEPIDESMRQRALTALDDLLATAERLANSSKSVTLGRTGQTPRPKRDGSAR